MNNIITSIAWASLKATQHYMPTAMLSTGSGAHTLRARFIPLGNCHHSSTHASSCCWSSVVSSLPACMVQVKTLNQKARRFVNLREHKSKTVGSKHRLHDAKVLPAAATLCVCHTMGHGWTPIREPLTPQHKAQALYAGCSVHRGHYKASCIVCTLCTGVLGTAAVQKPSSQNSSATANTCSLGGYNYLRWL